MKEYKVTIPEWLDDDELTVFARSASEAAEEAVKDNDETGLAEREDSVDVTVELPNGERRAFRVAGSLQIRYHATDARETT